MLTANSDPAEWWPGLIGDQNCFDPARIFINCEYAGSCYGSIGHWILTHQQVQAILPSLPILHYP